MFCTGQNTGRKWANKKQNIKTNWNTLPCGRDAGYCGLKIASNEGSLMGQRKCIPIHFDVNKDMLSRILLKAK